MAFGAPGKSVAVIVEGKSDKDFVEAMLGRLKINATVLKMDGQDYYKAVRLIKSVGDKANLIIVLLDQHCSLEEKVKEVGERIMQQLPEGLRGKTRIITVRRAIEAWVLADQEALKSLCNKASFNGDPEQAHDPAETLRAELKKCGKTYVKSTWGRMLGELVDPQRAKDRSRSLKEFLDTLADP